MEEIQGPAERLRAQSEELRKWEALVEHVGWTQLDGILQKQVENRVSNVLGEMANLLEVGKFEGDKGEIRGIELCRRLPYVRIKQLKESIDQLNEEVEDERESREYPGAGGAADVGGDFEPSAP